MRKLIKFILSQLENIFNSTARFKKVLNPDNPNEVLEISQKYLANRKSTAIICFIFK